MPAAVLIRVASCFRRGTHWRLLQTRNMVAGTAGPPAETAVTHGRAVRMPATPVGHLEKTRPYGKGRGWGGRAGGEGQVCHAAGHTAGHMVRHAAGHAVRHVPRLGVSIRSRYIYSVPYMIAYVYTTHK